MLFRSGDKESRIFMEDTEIRGNDRKTRKSWNSTKTRENGKPQETGETGVGRKGGPQPGPAWGPLLLLDRRISASSFVKKR